MNFCPQCGSEVNESAKFCIYCGYQILSLQQAPQADPDSKPLLQPREPVYELSKQAGGVFKDAVSGKTHFFQRVINILIKPKEEWLVIANEKPDKMKILFGYVIILAFIPTIISFLSFLINSSSFSFTYAVLQAILSFFLTLAIIFITAYIVDLLAPSFYSEINFDRSFQLISYAYTPAWIVSIMGLIPGIKIFAMLAGFAFMGYLLATGIPVLKKTPKDKATGYGVLLVVIMLMLYVLIGAIFKLVFLK